MIYLIMPMAFIATLLIGMDMPSTPTLSKEIIDNHFLRHMTLQEVSRFKRTCKDHSGVTIITVLPSQECSCSLDHLFNNYSYDGRAMILAHCGLIKNGEMFEFLWDKEKDLRDIDFIKYLYNPTSLPLEQRMDMYAKDYSMREKIQKIRLQEIKMAAHLGNDNAFSQFLKKILPGSGFNIWDITFVSSKKILSEYHTKQKTKKCRKKIVQSVCASEDADLLLAIMGGIIEPRALKYVFRFSHWVFIEALREKNAFIEGVPDKHGRMFAYYEREFKPRPITPSYRKSGLIH